MKKLLSGLFGIKMPSFNLIIEAAFEAAWQGFLFFGVIGFLLAVIVLLVINLSKSFRPTSGIFKTFNTLDFVYFPLLFVFFFGTFGSWLATKKCSVNEIHEGVLPSVKIIFPAFQLYLGMNSKSQNLKEAVVAFSSIVSISTDSDNWIEQQKVAVAKKDIPLMLYRGIDAIVETEIDNRGETDINKLELAENMDFFIPSATFWNTVEDKTIESTKNHFNKKLLWWGVYLLIAASFLMLQILLLVRERVIFFIVRLKR
ncbi:MAG: hypothetical protein JKY53_01955 [Flavobacteriales bacterium]|nr:hypothetical protein [Flavobacteriales bacterium]